MIKYFALSLNVGEDQNAIWNQLIDVVLDRSESCLARENCMLSLTNLLKWSENKDSYWLGPIVKISGITLTGEASMSSFLTLVHFEENVSRIFRAFSHKNGGVNDINNVHSIFNDESIRQTSAVTNTASLIQDEHDDEVIEEPSSASFVASVLKFLIQIIKMDTVSIIIYLTKFYVQNNSSLLFEIQTMIYTYILTYIHYFYSLQKKNLIHYQCWSQEHFPQLWLYLWRQLKVKKIMENC